MPSSAAIVILSDLLRVLREADETSGRLEARTLASSYVRVLNTREEVSTMAMELMLKNIKTMTA